jgi:hypothetical protein
MSASELFALLGDWACVAVAPNKIAAKPTADAVRETDSIGTSRGMDYLNGIRAERERNDLLVNISL